MDMRIHRTSLLDKLNGVDKTKRVNPPNQDEPEQDAQKFADQLQYAKKQQRDKEEEKRKKQIQSESGQENDDESSPKSKEKNSPDFPVQAGGEKNKNLGNNVDIKI